MLIRKISTIISNFLTLSKRIEDIQKSIGRVELRQLILQDSDALPDNEFKVFSQNGEDGIIQYLLRRLEIQNKIFVEFGVHDYTESNTRFLLQNNNWAGLIIDANEKAVRRVKEDPIYWQRKLIIDKVFINKDNINEVIMRNGVIGDIGLLSIDVDGNDYWIWEAINCISPRIVICEYNSMFGAMKKVTIPYDQEFFSTKEHYSGLYWGASIGAFDYLAKIKGYSMIGSNTFGNNVFFVRNDVVQKINIVEYTKAYVKSQFRISRNQEGELSFLSFNEGVNLISDMVLYEVDTGKTITVKDIH